VTWLWITLAVLLVAGTTMRSKAAVFVVVAALLLGWQIKAAFPHDIYTTLKNPSTGTICCNGRTNEDGVAGGDCEPTLAIAGKDSVRFWVRGQQWVTVPNAEVVFMNLPDEAMAFRQDVAPPEPNMVWGHFCGIPMAGFPDDVGHHDGWRVYCAFYPPGGS
jgi:hypothetical protein